jgi:hypothetical protein
VFASSSRNDRKFRSILDSMTASRGLLGRWLLAPSDGLLDNIEGALAEISAPSAFLGWFLWHT